MTRWLAKIAIGLVAGVVASIVWFYLIGALVADALFILKPFLPKAWGNSLMHGIRVVLGLTIIIAGIGGFAVTVKMLGEDERGQRVQR